MTALFIFLMGWSVVTGQWLEASQSSDEKVIVGKHDNTHPSIIIIDSQID